MANTTTLNRVAQDELFPDNELSTNLAAFVPLANKITDAAANYIDKAVKLLADDKRIVTVSEIHHLQRTITIAKQAVQLGDQVNRLLRAGDDVTITFTADTEESQ